jgi:hypothetical protein
MKMRPNDLAGAVDAGIISPEQAEQLQVYFLKCAQQQPGFQLTHILYYLGGLIAIGAMTLFMTLGWERFGGWGIFAIACCYGLLGLGLAEYFYRRKHLLIPSGIMATFVVALTPLAIYGLQVGLGLWVEGRVYRDYHALIDWRWFYMQCATLIVGVCLLGRYRLPFLVMPIAVTLWYMTMDIVPLFFSDYYPSWELRLWASLWFGLLILVIAFWVDIRSRHSRDFAFWLYFFGTLSFWGGLSLMNSDSELSKFFYLCINLGLIFVGAVITRKVFVVFGALGCVGYLGHLAYSVFADSLLFPFVLSGIGLGIIFLGILWQKHDERISQHLRGYLPATLREWLQAR